MRKFNKITKKILGVGLSAAMLATTMFTGGVASAEAADGNLINVPAQETGDATYIATFMKSDYLGGGRTGFEISFKYTELGTLADDNTLGYNDTFEFLVFDSNWGGWNRTTVGPNGVDKTAECEVTQADVDNGTVFTATVPFSVIESKLTGGGQANGINLQTGGIGTTKVTITSLKYVTGAEQKSEDVLLEGAWHKTGEDEEADFGTMEVKSGTAFVSANAWNIAVSGFSVKDFKKPIVAVTVNYKDITKTIYPQSEILDSNYEPVEPNYPQVSEDGDVTYLTYIPKDMTSMILAYDTCTVKTVEIYDEAEKFTKPIKNLKNDTIISNMGAGWNLGNALDAIEEIKDADDKVIGAVENPTAWGNPEVNKRLFKQVSAAGFKTARIPVSWIGAVSVNGDNYTIDEDQFARILELTKDTVDMAIDYNMFAIINIQHDGGENVTGQWLDIDAGNQTGIRKAFKEVWRRLAVAFKDYDQHLIFESMNEVMEQGNYGAPKDSTWENINALNKSFVETVRGEADSNATRFLLMPGYNTNITQTINGYNNGKFKIPTYNNSTEYEMVSVHYYDPYNFTLNTGAGSTTAITTTDLDAVVEQFSLLYSTFVANNIPVVIGEFGAVNKGNYDAIRQYTNEVVTDAKLFGIGYAYWDNGYTGEYGSALWNRYTYAQTRLGKEIIPVLTSK